MNEDLGTVREQLIELIDAVGAHMPFDAAVATFPADGLNRVIPNGVYTPWHLLEHIRFAQFDILDYIRNRTYLAPTWPDNYWPARDAVATPADFAKTVDDFRRDQAALRQLVADPATDILAPIPGTPGHTILREIRVVGAHNAYHLGEFAILRQVMGTWPADRRWVRPREGRLAAPLDCRSVTIPQSRLRNFSIIAHIDHGKSTLADRLLELTHAIDPRQMTSQVLDSMDLEREKGITIKARAVRLEHTAKDGLVYGLNLIDTPGHVDFSYEVSHSLQACEGAILVVDAAQGIEAQTLANVHLALREGLTIIPVLNKIDLPSAQPDVVMDELENALAIPREEVLLVSAKEGTGVAELLEAIVERVPPPKGDPAKPLQALVFDSHYDPYKGVIVYIRLAQGTLHEHDRVRLMASGAEADLLELGFFRPQLVPVETMRAGDVGYAATGLKNVREAQVGDTITSAAAPAPTPLPGYQEAKSLVFAGIYPVSGEDYPILRDAIEKLHLNDASFTYEPESSVALGFGFRCGFLGLLHMEIVQERLEREFGLNLIASAPSVEYEVLPINGRAPVRVDNPSKLPPVGEIEEIREPWVQLSVVTPAQYIGALMELSTNRRGSFVGLEYLDPTRVLMRFELPLAELIVDYYDQLKTRTAGYASMDYEEIGYRAANLVRLDVLVAGEPVDALSMIIHRDNAASLGRTLVSRLRQLIPRQLFEVPIQAAIGSNVIARETVRAMSKNVLAKCYGGDITRKRKLLEKQKEGKRRMKRVGSVEIPQEAFLAMLRTDES